MGGGRQLGVPGVSQGNLRRRRRVIADTPLRPSGPPPPSICSDLREALRPLLLSLLLSAYCSQLCAPQLAESRSRSRPLYVNNDDDDDDDDDAAAAAAAADHSVGKFKAQNVFEVGGKGIFVLCDAVDIVDVGQKLSPT